MDENYLDSLLKDVSSDDKFNMDLEDSVDLDSGVDIDFSDLGDLSLDELDDLDNIDLSSLELDDIDFDDVDVTNLSVTPVKETKKDETEDFDFDSLLAEVSSAEEEQPDDNPQTGGNDAVPETGQTEDIPDFVQLDDIPDIGEPDDISGAEQSDGGFDIFQEADTQEKMDDALGELVSDGTPNTESMDLDELFSALGIEENSDEEDYTANQEDLDSLFEQSSMEGLEGFDDIADIEEVKVVGDTGKKSKKTKKTGNKKTQKSYNISADKSAVKSADTGNGAGGNVKKSLSVLLFGEPDEDDEEEERYLEERKAQKAEKKAANKEKREEKKKISDDKKARKKQASDGKKKEKLEKKAALIAEEEAEEEKNPDKPVSTAGVVIVFAIFAALAGFVILGTKTFDYTMVIKKATDYFDRQRYRLAYDEISGVEVKEKDEDLKDRIYTVMYVERLYESYENNQKIGRSDKALDALLRGIEKYDEHRDEAVELNILEDIDICRAKIITALNDNYGLTEADAYEMIALEGQEYINSLEKYGEKEDLQDDSNN